MAVLQKIGNTPLLPSLPPSVLYVPRLATSVVESLRLLPCRGSARRRERWRHRSCRSCDGDEGKDNPHGAVVKSRAASVTGGAATKRGGWCHRRFSPGSDEEIETHRAAHSACSTTVQHGRSEHSGVPVQRLQKMLRTSMYVFG